MASTYTKLHYHLIFSTHARERIIHPGWEGDLHAFLGGCLRHISAHPIQIGGDADHVHILTDLRPSHKVCTVVGDIKSGSSRWVHDELGKPYFKWQEGYGAFSVSAFEYSKLQEYIRNQKEHHKKRSFVDEYKAFLKAAGIEWNDHFFD
jgi:REP element-mobilizing transposase RayT